ncbi:MAG: rane protein [Rubritepida sp.]|nr:rane protein [Rubritepida sp.]
MSPRLSLTLRRLARRIFTPLVIVLAVLWALLDVTIWRWLSALGRVLARVPLFAALERLVERLSPGWVIAVFVIPFVPLVPLLKLTELWLLANKHYFSAVVLIVGTKVVGAAFSTRVFAIAKPKMMQVRWFAKFYGAVAWLLELGYRTLDGIPAWRTTREWVHRVKLRLTSSGRGLVRRKWDSALRWLRRKASKNGGRDSRPPRSYR